MPTEFQKQVIEQIENIGNAIDLIEGICDNLEKLDPMLVSKIDEDFHYAQPITKFIINHRKYTLWYNEMRDFLFQELNNGAYIIKSDY